MKIAKTSDVVGIINKIANPSLAESWDNPGLQVGDPSAEVTRIMVALDPTPAVITAAISASCQLLVTHHPLIFKPLKSISSAVPQGDLIMKAIRGSLAVVTLHTNYDIATGGLNDVLATLIGIDESVPLSVTSTVDLIKLAVFVPADHLGAVRKALFPYTALQGNYRDCSFTSGGIGTFTPRSGAEPFIGSLDELSMVHEERLELLLPRPLLPRAIKALRAAHPYEEPAYDIYPLLNEGERFGIGRIGKLPAPVALADYAAQLKDVLHAPQLRYVGKPGALISKVALCSGGGASMLHDAARSGADVLVTGDVKYHDARTAEELGLAVIDAGHFPTEIIMVKAVAERLGQMLAEAGHSDVKVLECDIEEDPFHI